MHQQQLQQGKIAQDIYITSDKQDISTSSSMAITRKVNSGIEITEARGDEDVSRCSLTRSKLITVGEMRVTTKDTRTPQRLTFFSKPPHEDEGPFLMASFSSTPEMASSKTTSQAPRRRNSGLFTNFHEEVTAAPTAKPTRRSPYKSNKLTVSH